MTRPGFVITDDSYAPLTIPRPASPRPSLTSTDLARATAAAVVPLNVPRLDDQRAITRSLRTFDRNFVETPQRKPLPCNDSLFAPIDPRLLYPRTCMHMHMFGLSEKSLHKLYLLHVENSAKLR